ncbi:hypothetical protein DPMN_059658 [Dreissena polymorpha]|uniref:Uncharacterized protein n=1 Tax=Dreissena polymorpha TaxID=45954 RepID=A0A9D4C4L2_DREPO|nr:hypothetical protein DPMN_059658 [Dreissena polymorpha]
MPPPPPGGHVFQPTGTIFNFIKDTIGTNLLTKLHEDRTINVASRGITSHKRINALSPGGHVFQATETIFVSGQDFMGKNLLTKFHDDRTINENYLAPWRPCFSTIFELFLDIIGTNLLAKFHKDRTINVASTVLTSHIWKNAPTLYGHVFQATTNLLAKFHEDRTSNVAFEVLTRQMLTTHSARKAITKAHHEHIVLRRGKKQLQLILLKQLPMQSDLNSSNFHDWVNHATLREFTHGHVFNQAISNNCLSKFHEDWKVENVRTKFIAIPMFTCWFRNIPSYKQHKAITLVKSQKQSDTKYAVKFHPSSSNNSRVTSDADIKTDVTMKGRTAIGKTLSPLSHETGVYMHT